MADEMCFLHTKVIQAIQETSTADTSNVIHGFLYGVTESEIYHVLSSVKMIAPLKSGSFVREFLLGRCELPVGVDPVGVFLCNCELSELSNIIPISTETKVPETLICLHYKEKLEVYKYNRVSKESFLINYQVTDDNPLRNRVTLNLKTDLSVKYEFSSKRAQKERNCTNALQELQNVFTLPSTLYRYVGSGVSAGPSQSFGATLNDNLKSVTKKILNHWNEELNKKDRFTEVPVIHLEQLTQLTKPFKNPEHAPIILYSKLESTIITVQISLDVIILTPETTKLSEMPTLIQRAVTRQLLLFNTKLNQSEGMDPGQLKPMHLWPEDLLHPITPLVSKSPEEVPESWRSAQHSKYMIPAGRPCFRRTNRFEFEPDIGGMLINPHVSAKALDGNFSPDMIHCVRGRYAYHHYMQDNFDDDKWGCAYRSLQTLISWFRLQGYTKVPVPKHRDIQQTLVDMGDKPSSFVGSKEWIGSMEVGFVLDKLLQVDSKILRVDSGAALASKGRELVHHFRTQGTPIMIGGGVLAHTILGVAYNEESGEIRFLILDPHYTGVDDLKTVVDKKWCGWKGETFWSTSDFYNMCMPQRPNTF